LDLASRRQGKPVRPVWQAGQTDFVQKLPKDPKRLKSLSTSEQTKPWSSKDFLAQKPFSTTHRAKPVRPVWETGQAGFAWTVGKNTAHGSTLPKPNLDLPNRSTDLNKTLGILGTPHEESIAKFNPTKTRPKRRNQGNSAKGTSNPRTQETPKSSTFTHEFGRGIIAQRTTKGSHKFPPSNPQEKGPENNPKKSPREGSENHHKNNRRKHIQTLRNQAESSIHETKVHTRSSKPPDHPSLSTRFSMKLSC
jgi:hypothetical protein